MSLFPPPQFYYFSSSFLNSLPLHNINLSSPFIILISLLHNCIIFLPPPPPPHLFYIFFHPQIHRPPSDPTSTPHRPYIDPTSTPHRPYTQLFWHSFTNSGTWCHHHHIYIAFPPPPPQFYCSHSSYCFPTKHGPNRPTSGQNSQNQA